MGGERRGVTPAVHRYRVSAAWAGSTGEGYERYSRAHTVTVGDHPLALSADPAFRGDVARLNPEQLLLAAACSCQLLSFLAVAARARLTVLRYEDHAEAEMPERPRGRGITRVSLRPRIHLAAAPPGGPARVRALVEQAHRECYIASSLRCEIVLEPELSFEG